MASSNPPILDKNICKQCSENEISWKCESCNKLGCDQCLSDHFLKKTSVGHMIISVQDNGQSSVDTEVERYCKTHPKEAFQRYCEMCDCLVCFECAVSCHNQHKLCSIPEIVQKKCAEYEGILREITKTAIPALEEIIQTVRQGQEDYNIGIQNLVEEITNQAEKLKTEIDEVKDLFIKELKEKQEFDFEMLKASQEKYEKELARMKCNIEMCKAKLLSTDGIELLVIMERMKDKLKQSQKCVKVPPVVGPPQFHAKATNQEELKKIFGNLDTESEIENTSDDADREGKMPENPNVKVISKFAEKGPVTCIATHNQDAWILCSDNLSLTRKDGSKEKSFQVDFHINDMAVSVYRELLVTDRNGRQIKRLLENGKFVNWVDTTPYEPYGIFVCEGGDLYVTVKSGVHSSGWSKYDSKLRDKSDAVVLYLSKHGQILKIYCSIHENRFYNITCPYYISLNNNKGKIALCERYTCMENVVIVDRNETEDLSWKYAEFEYAGNEDAELHHPFSPQAIAYLNDDLLVTDYCNSVIHTVDQGGNFTEFFMTALDGLNGPMAIDVDMSGHVWIGCVTGTVFVVKVNK